MALDITFLGHAGFLLEDGSHAVVIDPFLTGNPVATHKPEDIRCGHIVLTHGHADHFGDTLAIAKANDAVVYCAFEIYEYLNEQGHTKCQPGNPGGRIQTDFGWVAFTQAIHSSALNGRTMGVACGVIVHMGGVTIYHCGDTDLFGDMKLIGEFYKPEIAFIPIGDRFTMGPELGTMAAELIKPKVAVPIHYGTFPDLLVPDASGFQPKGMETKVLAPGERWKFGK